MSRFVLHICSQSTESNKSFRAPRSRKHKKFLLEMFRVLLRSSLTVVSRNRSLFTFGSSPATLAHALSRFEMRRPPAITIAYRSYAKKGTKSKSNKDADDDDDDDDNSGGRSKNSTKSGGAAVKPTSFEVKDLETAMDAVLKRLSMDLSALRGNKASPGWCVVWFNVFSVELFASIEILHKIVVKKPDATTAAILKVAQITVKDPKTLLVSVFDEANVGAVQNAIVQSNLGLNPTMLGKFFTCASTSMRCVVLNQALPIWSYRFQKCLKSIETNY
jgi:hypothetical protein